MTYAVRLSERSYQHIHDMARAWGYPPHRTGAFIAAAVLTEGTIWQDRRPDHIKDVPAIHDAPIWYDGSPRWRHVLGPIPVSAIVALAERFNVKACSKQQSTLQGSTQPRIAHYRKDSDRAVVSAVLEAIGIGWLVPLNPPTYRKPTRPPQN